jgi:hypothetical protein
MGAAWPEARTLSTGVVGVSEGDGQRVIRKNCREGDRVRLSRDRWNRHSRDAIQVWIPKHGYFSRGWYLIGHLPEEDAATVTARLSEGWKVEAFIERIVGGSGLTYALRIDVQLLPPPRPAAHSASDGGEPASSEPIRPAWRLHLPPIPEPIRRRLRIAADFLIHHAGPYLAGAWVLCLLWGRPFDPLGVGIVAALAYLGVWAVHRVLAGRDERHPSG